MLPTAHLSPQGRQAEPSRLMGLRVFIMWVVELLICEEEGGVRSLIRPFQMWFDTRKQCERSTEAGSPTEKTELQTLRQTETWRDNHLCERAE